LLASLRSRRVNHKFHYDSIKQTQQWLALHAAYSPSRTEADCAATYAKSFAAVAGRTRARRVHLVGLGCGGGRKDTSLLRRLCRLGKEVFYTPADVSTAMVLVARQTARTVVPVENCAPLVCDLATAADLPGVLDAWEPFRTGRARSSTHSAARLLTFFGMLPNFEPGVILPRLAALVRRGDFLLLSANLAPGLDYAAGVERILPLYDNRLTHDWLMTFLLDLGVEWGDGELRFVIEDARAALSLKRVVAHFRFAKARRLEVEGEPFQFRAGERIRLFFSYRHTPDRVRTLLGRYGLRVLDEWITRSETEGVFLAAPH